MICVIWNTDIIVYYNVLLIIIDSKIIDRKSARPGSGEVKMIDIAKIVIVFYVFHAI